MRTDVKIGLAAGLLLVIAFVTYHAVFTDDAADSDGPEQQLASTDGADKEKETTGRGGPRPVETVLPRFGGISGRPRTGTPVGTETPNMPTTPVTPVIPEPPPTPEPIVTPVISEPPPTPEPTVTPVVTPGGPTITPVVPGAGETAGLGGQTYTVRKGDAGFWAIAEKVYGDGRLWPLIAKANPGADSNALPPGKKLRIPPRPVTRPSRPGGEAAGGEGAGGLVVLADGRKQYVVKKGDAGFWGIAQVVYGNGKHWTLIAKANPSFNSTSLKPGDSLVIPPRPAAIARPTAPVPTITPGLGEKVYTVQKSDSAGFWGIAEKLYGSGRYWQVIAKANPSADSSSLREGQKLLIPSLTDEMRRLMARRAATRPRPTRVPHDIEDIGRQPTF